MILSTMMVKHPWTWLELMKLDSFREKKTGVKVYQCQSCQKVWNSLFGCGTKNPGELHQQALKFISCLDTINF